MRPRPSAEDSHFLRLEVGRIRSIPYKVAPGSERTGFADPASRSMPRGMRVEARLRVCDEEVWGRTGRMQNQAERSKRADGAGLGGRLGRHAG